jgi:hypothetical protein
MPRPRPVTILAFLVFFLAASNLLTGILLFSGELSVDDFVRQMPRLADMKETFEHTAVFVAVLSALAYVIAGLGLLRMKNWARATTRALAVLGLLNALVYMMKGFFGKNPGVFLYSAIVGGGYYWAFYYLGQASVRAAFAPHPPPGSAPQPPVAPGPDSSG